MISRNGSLILFALLTIPQSVLAGGTNCPDWLDGTSAEEPIECWAPSVTYRENIALLTGDTPVYVTRIERLDESEHTFDTSADLRAYIQTVIIVRGFWVDHPTRCYNNGVRCLLVPPSAIEHVELRQIRDWPRGAKR